MPLTVFRVTEEECEDGDLKDIPLAGWGPINHSRCGPRPVHLMREYPKSVPRPRPTTANLFNKKSRGHGQRYIPICQSRSNHLARLKLSSMGQRLAFVITQPSVTTLQHPVRVYRRQTQSGALQALTGLLNLLSPAESQTVIQAFQLVTTARHITLHTGLQTVGQLIEPLPVLAQQSLRAAQTGGNGMEALSLALLLARQTHAQTGRHTVQTLGLPVLLAQQAAGQAVFQHTQDL